MSFLFPSVLWGLFASLIPLIIHLFNQNTTKTVEFSSIQHIKALENDSIRSLKLKQWILVLIRTIIIVCLILMCSGPIQRNNSKWVPSTKESVAVIVIDNSASLGVEKNGETYLEKNISLLPRIFSAFEGVTNLKIYQTNPPKMIFNDFIEEGIEVDYENLKIQQSMGKDNLWFFVDSILQFVNDNTPNKELYILSDIPSNPPSNFMNNHDEWQFYFTENDKALNNLSINTVSTVNQMKLPNHLLKLNTRIENSGNTERKNIPIELYLNEERIGQIVSSFTMNRTKDFLFQAYPGKSGIIKGRIEISKDDFAFDNTKTFEMYIPERISCKVIASDVSKSSLIKIALDSISGNDSLLDIELKEMPSIDILYLDQTDVLFLLDPANITPKGIQALKIFLQKGGSIFWISGQNYRNIDSEVLVNLNLPIYQNTVSVGSDSYFSANIVNRENPIFNELNLRNPKSSLPKIFKYNKVETKKNHKQILALNNNDPLLVEIQSNSSKILFLSSPMDLEWNNLGLKGLIIPLLHRSIILSAIDEFNTTSIEIGMVKEIKVPSQLINQKWKLITPKKNEIFIIPNYEKERLDIKSTNELGSYDVYVNGEFYTAFSTSLSKYEAPKIRANLNELVSNFQTNRASILPNSQNIVELIKSKRHGKSLWRIFLTFAVFLFLVESFLSRPISRKPAI